MIIAGTSDAGPARYLLAMGDSLTKPIQWIGSPISGRIFDEYGQKYRREWSDVKPDLVLTGTSQGPCIDKELTKWARRLGAPCVSVVEHWSWYRKRFELDDELILPDFIIVNDEIARDQAEADGLPRDRLIVGGNPWLERLSLESLPEFDRQAWRSHYGLPSGRLVVFISEELRGSFPIGSKDYLGYDEFSVLKILRAALPSDAHLVIKRHPEEPLDKYSELFHSGEAFQLDSVPLTELAQGADAIVGMASMLLIELAMFRDDVISFRPGARLPFIGETISATTPAEGVSMLSHLLKTPFGNSTKTFRSRFRGSGARIVEFLNGFTR